MKPSNERLDDDDHSESLGDENKESEVAPDTALPLPPGFPPPPEISYTRPMLKRGMYANNPDYHPGVSEDQNAINTTARLGAGMSAGITFASSVIVSVLLGMWLDKKFEPNSVPWATMALTILGFVAGFMNFMRISTATDQSKKPRK